MSRLYHLLGVPSDSSLRFSLPFTTSWLLSPLPLSFLRLLIALYAFVTRFYGWGWYATHSQSAQIGHGFSYFTELSYWGLSFYMLVAGVHTLLYALRGHCWLDAFPRPLQAAHSVLYTTVITLPFLVTIVYWGVLNPNGAFSGTFDIWSNVSQHALNSLFAILELLLPTTAPPPPLHLALLILLLALYLCVAYITHATEGWYAYDFLDPSQHPGRVAAHVFAIAGGFIVLFVIVGVVIWARRRLTPGPKLSKYDRGYGREGSRDVEMSAVQTK